MSAFLERMTGTMMSGFRKVMGAVALAAMGMVSFGTQAASTITYYHNDLLGSPVVATNASGQVIWRESYRPYGERLTNAPASAPNDVWFTSRRQDAETGLVYMGARYYDPAIGRFISKDPVGFNEGSIHSFNRYAYANNNPYKFIDPAGRDAVIVTRRDGSISVRLPIIFSGDGATSESISSIKADISGRWSGTYDIDQRSVYVSVEVIEGALDGILNTIALTNDRTSNEDRGGASFVSRRGNSGEWDVTSSGMSSGEAAHEAGHLMGERDYYEEAGNNAEGKRMTRAMPGYERHLMGALGGNTDSTSMSNILSSPNNKRITE